jgi:signal transduction histidine kinase
MNRPRGVNALLAVVLILLAAGLGVLATLQYRWIDRVSVTDRQQMRANLELAGRNFSAELRRELEPILNAFEEGRDLMDARPDLVQAVYVVERENGRWSLRSTDGIIDWPPQFQRLYEQLESADLDLSRGPPRMPGPFQPEIPALLLVERHAGLGGPAAPPTLVLVHLDRHALREEVLPRLLRQHFTNEYDVAIVSGPDDVYRSGSAWPDGRTPPDIEIPLEPVLPRRGPNGLMGPLGTRSMDEMRPPNPGRWRLLVRRHDGGVDAAVSAARMRNLAVSSGIVFILGAAVVLLVALLRRAEKLRRQQIEFVAAISHELNTPVAALRSAGENLRDRIIHEPDKVARYGESIVRESTRLGALVGQVLELAGMQARKPRSHEALDVTSLIEDAIAQCAWLVAGTPIRIETTIEKDLPPISGDRDSLTRAIQNLVANAIRHGGSGEWIGVHAWREEDQVRITVEDRGPGIDASEAARLFEPFYRGSKSASTPGAGLGLAIVKQVAIDHGGDVHLERRRDGAAFTIAVPAVVQHG